MNLQRLKDLRVQRKISLKDMAKQTKYSRQLLSRLENGDTNVNLGALLSYIDSLGDMELRLQIKD